MSKSKDAHPARPVCGDIVLAGIGRDVDAFHGIAENTSTNAVGYEGYLAWAAAAAIVAPTTLYAVFLVKPPTLAVYRGAALKCLTLIAFWSFAAAGLRVTDYLIALDRALTKLADEDSMKADLVKLRYFAGLTIEQTAKALGVSEATAKRYWTYARAWLVREID